MLLNGIYQIKSKWAITTGIYIILILFASSVLFYSCTNNAPANQKAFFPPVSMNVKDSSSKRQSYPYNQPEETGNIPQKPGEPITVNSNYVILDCPDVLQNNDYSCGVWAGLTVLGYYGITEYADTLSKQMNTNPESGTEMEDIVKVLNNYGLKTSMRQMAIEELKDFVRQKIPVIVMMQAYNPSGNYQGGKSLTSAEWGHYVTIIGYGDGNIVFEDPDTFGKTYLSEKQFKTRWKGTDEYNGQKEKILYHFGIVAYGKKPQFKKSTDKLIKMP